MENTVNNNNDENKNYLETQEDNKRENNIEDNNKLMIDDSDDSDDSEIEDLLINSEYDDLSKNRTEMIDDLLDEIFTYEKENKKINENIELNKNNEFNNLMLNDNNNLLKNEKLEDKKNNIKNDNEFNYLFNFLILSSIYLIGFTNGIMLFALYNYIINKTIKNSVYLSIVSYKFFWNHGYYWNVFLILLYMILFNFDFVKNIFNITIMNYSFLMIVIKIIV